MHGFQEICYGKDGREIDLGRSRCMEESTQRKKHKEKYTVEST